MRILLVFLLVLSAGPAAAQSTAPRFSLLVGAGSVGSTSSAMPGAMAMVSAGTDLRLSRNWELRVEAGRRFPSHRSWEPHSLYYYPSPDDPSQSIEADTTQIAAEDTLIDVAVLLRRAWPIRERFEAALLTGVDVSVVKFHHHLAIRPSPGDPDGVEEVYDSSNRRALMVFDVGVEGGMRVGERWRVLAYGIAGLQSLFEENRGPQLRSGIALKRVF